MSAGRSVATTSPRSSAAVKKLDAATASKSSRAAGDRPRNTASSPTNTRESGARNDPESGRMVTWLGAAGTTVRWELLVTFAEQLGLRLVRLDAVLLREHAGNPVPVHPHQHAESGRSA